MRRLCRLLCAALLAGGLLVPATVPAQAAPDPAAGDGAADTLLLLAIEGGEVEPPGPEPSGPNAPGNSAAPRNYDANFLWGAAIGLLVLTVLGIAGLGALYFLLVVRPRRQEARTE